MAKATPQSCQINWCGWGYDADFTPEHITGVIPRDTPSWEHTLAVEAGEPTAPTAPTANKP